MNQGRTLSPISQAAYYQWLYLGVLAERYPERMNAIREGLHAYQTALNERDLPPGVAGINEVVYARSGLGDWILSPAMHEILGVMGQWASQLKLLDPYGYMPEWVEDAGLGLLRELATQPSLSVQAYCMGIAEGRRLPGEQFVQLDPNDPQPQHVGAFPQQESEDEFLKRAQHHYQETSAWYLRRGYVNELTRRGQTIKHLHWLAAHRVEGLDFVDISIQENERAPGIRGVGDSNIEKQCKALSDLIWAWRAF
ncbi:hypothetical protein [Deinococcus sp.]|uniref:hypothetical protein n=1 Tax=Deinococcus sp. TaxID=47478 RepID=UPI003C7C0F71